MKVQWFCFVICITVIVEELHGEDNFNAFLAEPILPVARKIEQRRKTDFVSRTKVSDIPIRENARPIHRSVLAMSSSSPKFVLEMPNDKPKVNGKYKLPATTEMLQKRKKVGK